MKFRIAKSDIINELNNLQRITSKTSPDIMIYRNNDKIVLSSTNNKIILIYELEARDISGEPISIKAKDFYNIVDKLDGVFEFDDGKIINKKIKVQIPVSKDVSVNNQEEIEKGKIISLDEFKTIMKKRFFACSKLDSNEVLKNICINQNEACSIDGNVVSIGKFKEEIGNFLIPQEVANEVIRCFNGDKIEISEQKNKLIFKNDKVTLLSFKVNSLFPKYQQLLPKGFKDSFTFNKSELLKNLEVLKLVADEFNKVKFTIEEDKLKLSCLASNTCGDIEQDIKYKGDKMDIYFSIKYLIDIMNNIDEEEIKMQFDNPISPCVFQDKNDYMLLMPIRVLNS